MSYWQQPVYIGLVFKTVLVNWRHCFIIKEAGKWKNCISHGKIMWTDHMDISEAEEDKAWQKMKLRELLVWCQRQFCSWMI